MLGLVFVVVAVVVVVVAAAVKALDEYSKRLNQQLNACKYKKADLARQQAGQHGLTTNVIKQLKSCTENFYKFTITKIEENKKTKKNAHK